MRGRIATRTHGIRMRRVVRAERTVRHRAVMIATVDDAGPQ
jgi:hypothetical protein